MSPSKDDPPSGSSTPKIAIKGFSLTSKNTSAKPTGARSNPASSLGKRPRSTFAPVEESDSEHEGVGRSNGGRHEVVTGFGAEGAIKRDEKRKDEPLVIPRLGNRDWRGEARMKRLAGGRNLLPHEEQAAREAAAKRGGKADSGGQNEKGVDVVNGDDAEIQWGLSVRKRHDVANGESNGSGPAVGNEDKNQGRDGQTGVGSEKVQLKEKTADEEALEALLGARTEKKGPDLVIPAVASPPPEYDGPVTEQDAYRRAIQLAPDVSTLDDYERVPVEEFGAALLRGMGWKGEKKGGVKEVKRRQNLLGLGAKELKDAEELGAWVQKSDIKRLNGGADKKGGERRPKANEYKREKEKRDERREERGGGSYRRDREYDGYRDGRDYRDRDRDRRR